MARRRSNIPQIPFSERGKLRSIRFPLHRVRSSSFETGSYETAILAGFTDIEKTADLTEGGLVVSPNEKQPSRGSLAQDAWRGAKGGHRHLELATPLFATGKALS